MSSKVFGGGQWLASVGQVLGITFLGLALAVLIFTKMVRPRQAIPLSDQLGGLTNAGQDDETLPINQLVLVGTHDSASYQILTSDPSATFSPSPSEFSGQLPANELTRLARHCNGCQRVLTNWTLTQQHTVGDQLKLGVRALDLRVARTTDGRFVYAHTLPNEMATVVLDQVRQFLDDHPRAFLVIFSQADWQHQHTMVEPTGYFRLVEKMLGRHRLLPVESQYPVLKDALDQGHQVMFIYSGAPTAGGEGMNWIWPPWTLDGVWIKESGALEAYRQQLKHFVPFQEKSRQSPLTQLRLIATPDQSTIVDYYKNHWLRDSSVPGNLIQRGLKTQQEWLCDLIKGQPAALEKVNIWWVDAPTPEFISALRSGGGLTRYCSK